MRFLHNLKESAKHAGFAALACVQRQEHGALRDVRNFLIVQHEAALGTAVHTTPLIGALRAAVPGARIVVAGSGLGLEVFRNHPGVDELLAMPNPLRDGVGEAASWLRQFRADHAEEFATLTPLGNERAGIALALWRGGAGNRVGFTLAPEIYRAPLRFDPALSQIQNNLRILEALGHGAVKKREPEMYFAAEDTTAARALLGDTYDPQRPLVAFITQTSPTQRKSWRRERFVAAAHFLVQTYGAQIAFLGTAGESAAIEALRSEVRGDTFNVAGKTSLQQLAALLALCDVALSLDTGTLHVARAMGLPAVIIAPAWSPVVEWLPVGSPRYRILKNATMPAATADYVIDEVSVGEVTAALEDLLREFPRSAL